MKIVKRLSEVEANEGRKRNKLQGILRLFFNSVPSGSAKGQARSKIILQKSQKKEINENISLKSGSVSVFYKGEKKHANLAWNDN